MTYLRGVVEASKLTIGNKAPTVSELLGYYLGRTARDNDFISKEINFIWTSFDDPKAISRKWICSLSLNREYPSIVLSGIDNPALVNCEIIPNRSFDGKNFTTR